MRVRYPFERRQGSISPPLFESGEETVAPTTRLRDLSIGNADPDVTAAAIRASTVGTIAVSDEPRALLSARTMSATSPRGAVSSSNKLSAIGGIIGGVITALLILATVFAVFICIRRLRAQRHRECRHRRLRQNLRITALPIMTTEPGVNVGTPREKIEALRNQDRGDGLPSTVDIQRAGLDVEVIARLDMMMERIARLEEDRDREEAPPDYVSTRS
ncbi:hypothetical protein PQX77_007987 [Marasmius sp. AFHP31]|nr:hypothetical protein PQX77_007987 [Marasmius sp. AFHP31]